jgi:transcription elongation GreA/GreB family factor
MTSGPPPVRFAAGNEIALEVEMQMLTHRTSARPRSRRLRASAPYDLLLTAEDRSMFQRRAEDWRERRLPALLRMVAADPEDGSARSAYAEALVELRRIESLLAAAQPVVTQRGEPDQVSLGDRVTVEAVGGPPPAAGSTRVEADLVLVHPFEVSPDLSHVSVASPLGRAVLGHHRNEVVEYDTATGPHAVRILGRADGP